MGPVEKALRADVADMGELAGTERSVAQIAYVIAKAIDDCEDVKSLPNLSKELRLLVKQLDGLTDGGDDEWSNLASPE